MVSTRRLLPDDQHRLARHFIIDPQRLQFARLSIGAVCGPFAGIFGSPNAVVHYMPLDAARWPV
jgi:hypothetical protein